MGEIKCLSCGKECEDYKELALHISSSKKGHRKGKKWAARYINKNVINKRKVEFNGRIALTTEQKISKEDTRRKLSGNMEYANVVCPKCERTNRPLLEVEYVNNSQAWRIRDRLAKLCNSCGGM